ncbi:MAG: hypothetical protein AB1505_25590 [Candidatus Latescibacterota bacterium]
MTDPIDIGSRRELFVDDFLVEEVQGLRFELQRPERREVVWVGDAPWEDDIAFPLSVVQEEGVTRLFYRASLPDRGNEDRVVYAVAESRDGGLSFTRPDLGLVEFHGSRRNNICFIGEPPFVPPPGFRDANPRCRPEERYKGLSARWRQLWAMASPDGVHWRPMSEEPLAMEGTFDTVNTAFWDTVCGCYRCYTRYFENLVEGAGLLGSRPTAVRAIQTATSPDFLHWSPVAHLEYDDPHAAMQLYTNAAFPCPGAEHLYVAFPNRYVQERVPRPEHPHPGTNDALFMSSRDGVHWRRWAEAWVRPGPDPLNWTERNNYPCWGIVATSPAEWSMFITEHYRHPPRPTRLRRLAVRPRGFVALRGDYAGGQLHTRPLVFQGRGLHLNYCTSAAGQIRVEVQDAAGRVMPGYGLEDMEPVFGDTADGVVRWREREGVGGLAGRPVRLRVEVRDADLFALCFV